jgi:hypothetical protein
MVLGKRVAKNAKSLKARTRSFATGFGGQNWSDGQVHLAFGKYSSERNIRSN